jgi:hypothetical protein
VFSSIHLTLKKDRLNVTPRQITEPIVAIHWPSAWLRLRSAATTNLFNLYAKLSEKSDHPSA